MTDVDERRKKLLRRRQLLLRKQELERQQADGSQAQSERPLKTATIPGFGNIDIMSVDPKGQIRVRHPSGMVSVTPVTDENLSRLGLEKPRPSFTGGQIIAEATFEMLENGEVGIQDVMQNTVDALQKEHGIKAVVPTFEGSDITEIKVNGRKLNLKNRMRDVVKAQQAKLLEGVDPTKGLGSEVGLTDFVTVDANQQGMADFITRAMAGTKMTDTGRLNFLRERFEPNGGKVVPILNFEDNDKLRGFLIVKPDGSKVMLDEEQASLGDIADVSGEILEGGLSMLATLGLSRLTRGRNLGTGGNIGLNSVIDAGANAIRQLASEAVGGQEGLTAGERFGIAGTAAASGAALSAGAVGVKKAGEAVQPRNFVQSMGLRERVTEIGKAGADRRAADVARETLQEARSVGVELTPAQASGSPSLGLMEWNLRRRMGGAAQLLKSNDVVQTNALAKAISKTAGAGADSTGRLVGRGIERFSGHLTKKRSQIAGKLFREADELSKGGGLVSLDSGMARMDQWINDLDTPGLPPNSPRAKALTELKETKRRLLEAGGDSGSVPAKTLQSQLETWSKKWTTEVKDPTLEDAIGATLKGAFEEDLERAAKAGAKQSSVAAAKLRDARNAWRALSAARGIVRKGAAAKVLKMVDNMEADKIPAAMLGSGFSDQGMKRLTGMLRHSDPAALRKIRGSIMQEIIDRSAPAVNSDLGIAEAVVSPAKLASNIAKHEKRLRVIFGTDKAAFEHIRKLKRVAQRLSSAEAGGSMTAPNQEAADIIQSVVKGALSPMETLGRMTTVLGRRRLAAAITNPEAVDLMLKISDPKPSIRTAQTARMVGRVIQLAGTQAMAEDETMGLFEQANPDVFDAIE